MAVTNRQEKKDEKQQNVINELIKKAKKEWERIVDCLPEPIALLDRDHRVLRLNKAMAHVMGVTPREAVGQVHCLYQEAMGKDSAGCPHTRLLEDKKVHISEIYLKRLDRYFEIRAIPDINPNDQSLIGSVFFARDITEIKNAEREKQRLQTQLLQAQKLEAVGQLAAGIAHEINTPAQFVGTNIDFLSDSFQDIEKLMNSLQQLITGVSSIPDEGTTFTIRLPLNAS
jgi:PAS domain S-box-containing protein